MSHWQAYMFIGVVVEDVWRLLTHCVAQIIKRLRSFSISRFFYWWAHLDSNQGPKDYESSALTN